MAKDSPSISRRRLARVLGLSADASRQQIEAAMPRLMKRLLRRLDSAEEADSPTEAIALRREITDLETSRAYFAASPGDRSGLSRWQARLGVLLGTAFTVGLLLAYNAGYRISRMTADESVTFAESNAQLILDGRLPGAVLRVLDADREELLIKVPAEEAHVELAEGRYAIEVNRPDCPDRWTRSIYFEAASTHRFEPLICQGEGRLTVRSNVSRDRLRIDGFDVGPTGETLHALGVGDHEIQVEKAGYQPFLGKVRIRPDEELELRAELVAGSAGPPIGRPMPVTKVAPTKAPSATVRPEPFDVSSLEQGFKPKAAEFGLTARDLLPDDFDSRNSTGGGSTAWHDRVSAEMIARYDRDGSGLIDQLEESEAISCAVWLEIERDFDGGGLGLPMVRYYGFDGSEWHPKALGFARSHRSAVFEKMKECGLAP
jgi:hypothetical protein